MTTHRDLGLWLFKGAQRLNARPKAIYCPVRMTTEPNHPRILVVDDDEQVLGLHELVLKEHGYQVETALNGVAALQALQRTSFDVILSDIDMPQMNGIQLLERVRAEDLDVPILLITGRPSVDTAIQAIEQGALRYLVKPVTIQALLKVVADAVRLHKIATAKRQALELAGGVDRFIGDHAGLVSSFGRALDSLHMAYQPIVSWSNRSVFAYEALLRSKETSLPHPGAILDAAERLGRLHDLGRSIRKAATEPLDALPSDVVLFVNVHPMDLLDDQLFSGDGYPPAAAARIVLEITERAPLDRVRDIRRRMTSLRAMGFRIALDDLGAGYAGLTSFALLEPEFVKLDMALVRNIDQQPSKQTVVRTMITMCKELGMIVTAEGIETAEERDELMRLGCDLMQGYLFSRPGEPFPKPVF
jgi:EAL domain-containing protein (putative c-di-GMP-specific phosphodiesterase class I)